MSVLQQSANKKLILILQTASTITTTAILESSENQKIIDASMGCDEQEHRYKFYPKLNQPNKTE